MEFKGFTYGFDARKGMLATESAALSMERLAELGGNYVCLTVCNEQEHFYSSTFGFDYRRNVTDKELIGAIKKFRELGLKICLKPMVNCMDSVWRAYIGFPPPQSPNGHNYWEEWFACYNAFMCHYAEIAADYDIEMLCLGCEMIGTEQQEEHWRKLISDVRGIYAGKLIYNANHGKEDNINWFDAIDYIGTSAYYSVAKEGGASVEEMMEAWEAKKPRLKALSEKHGGKKIVFIEIGCRSAKGCATMPYDFSHKEFPFSEEEQANFYESSLRSMWNEEWFGGYFWWDWGTNLPKDTKNVGFSIYGKKAETIVKEWYKKS